MYTRTLVTLWALFTLRSRDNTVLALEVIKLPNSKVFVREWVSRFSLRTFVSWVAGRACVAIGPCKIKQLLYGKVFIFKRFALSALVSNEAICPAFSWLALGSRATVFTNQVV
jgi:hypothetical protein